MRTVTFSPSIKNPQFGETIYIEGALDLKRQAILCFVIFLKNNLKKNLTF